MSKHGLGLTEEDTKNKDFSSIGQFQFEDSGDKKLQARKADKTLSAKRAIERGPRSATSTTRVSGCLGSKISYACLSNVKRMTRVRKELRQVDDVAASG